MRENQGTRLEDRLLGEEWADWRPGIRQETALKASRWLFIFLSFFVLVTVLMGLLLFWYLSLPRFESFGTIFAAMAGITASFIAIVAVIWYFLQILTSVFKIKLTPIFIVRRFSLRIFLPAAIKIGGFFGVSRDRIGSSFVKFHNDLMRAVGTGKSANKFLLLLPRCLSAESRKSINELADKYRFKTFTAFGGDEARKVIKEQRPEAVIGVACERDLISGIQDTAHKIAVFGVPNTRPEGPCKNTSVDIKELEEIIRYCSGL